MHAIEVQHLVKRFDAVEAVAGLSFKVADGATVALLGGNGAAKTTTIAMILVLIVPTSGAITVFGHDIAAHRYRVLAQMNFQSPYVDLPRRLTVRQNLKVYGALYGVRGSGARIAALA